jgi:hypothetical protein
VLRTRQGCFSLRCARVVGIKFGHCHALLARRNASAADHAAANVLNASLHTEDSLPGELGTGSDVYYAFVPMAPRPTKAFIRAAASASAGQGAAHPHEVLFVVLASCNLPKRLQMLHKTWCRETGVQCWAYTDCEQRYLNRRFAPIRFVPPSAYMHAYGHAPLASSCCAQGLPRTDGGPSQFFCHSHRHRTLQPQYRFLPAMAHARASNFGAFRTSLKWLAVLDDDTWVSVPRLLHTLSRINHTLPVYLGDFVKAVGNRTHWRQPYACGGAGTILSGTAVVQTDFGSCARAFNNTCQQSDWMVGRCVRASGVVALTSLSCRACGRPVYANARRRTPSAKLQTRLEASCAFAQYTDTLMSKHEHALVTRARVENVSADERSRAEWFRHAVSGPTTVHLNVFEREQTRGLLWAYCSGRQCGAGGPQCNAVTSGWEWQQAQAQAALVPRAAASQRTAAAPVCAQQQRARGGWQRASTLLAPRTLLRSVGKLAV